MRWLLNLLVILLLRYQSLEARCVFPAASYPTMKCNLTNEEELLYEFHNTLHFRKFTYFKLVIENSNLHHLDRIPRISLDEYGTSHLVLIIRQSGVETINSECFKQWFAIKYLDLSYNTLRETNFLKSIYSVKELNISHNKVENLNGSTLKHLLILENLDLSYNNMKTISNLTNPLRVLNLAHNSLTGLGNSLINLKHIENIDLSYNKLFKISRDNIPETNIELLDVRHNEIIFLDSQIVIGHISASGNRISQYNIAKFGGRSIDLSNNTISGKILDNARSLQLDSIDYSNNGIKSLDFHISKNGPQISIDNLLFEMNNITKLHSYNFKNIAIWVLDLSRNNIEYIEPETFASSNIRYALYLNHNNIKVFNNSIFDNLTSLKVLNASHNPLKVIEKSTFSNIECLEVLDLSYCLLEELDPELFQNSINLKALNLSYNSIKILPGNIFSQLRLDVLNLGYNEILGFGNNVFNNSEIQNLMLEGLIFYEINDNNFSGLNSITFLNLSNLGIKELHKNSFDKLKMLQHLCLDNNHIEKIPKHLISSKSDITHLSLIGNDVSFIHKDAFTYYSKLEYLNITIKSGLLRNGFMNLVNLVELNIVDSEVKYIQNGSFRGLVALEKLGFKNSNISKIEPGAFVGLKYLSKIDCQNLFKMINILETNIFKGLRSVRILNLSKLSIQTIENNAFSGLDALIELSLNHNEIRDLPKNAFMGLKELQILDLSHNNLTGKKSTFPLGIFRELENLEELHLHHNRIIQFHIGEFSNLHNLRYLNISNNQLSYLERHLLFPLKKLEVLDINSNYVIKFDYEFSIKHLHNLKTVGIGSNKWKCENLTTMLHIFGKNNIDYLKISQLEYETENIDGIYCVHLCNYLYCPTEEDLVVT